MQRIILRGLQAAAVLALAAAAPMLGSDLNNNEVEFSGEVVSVLSNGQGGGTLFIHFNVIDLKVIANASTDVEDTQGDPIPLDQLQTGDFVEVTGKYSSGSILASSVRLLDSEATDFQVRGHITALVATGQNWFLSMLGLRIVVDSDTIVEQDGMEVSPDLLKIGAKVQVQGDFSNDVWTATSVKILSEGKKPANLSFEGRIVTLQPDHLQVEVSGLSSNITEVILDENTRVVGTLAEGALVQVKGSMNADFTVLAREVKVLQALEIKPASRKIKIGQNASFTVKLRDNAAADTAVTLSVTDQSIVSLSADQITVPMGTKTAEFSVTGLDLGSTEVHAAALGDDAVAVVDVGTVSEEEGESPSDPGDALISFAPDKIKLNLNDEREVVLHVKPPQKTLVAIDYAVETGIVEVAGDRVLSNGAAQLKVLIRSFDQEGTDSVVATLPDSLGGGKAELLVEVSAKKK